MHSLLKTILRDPLVQWICGVSGYAMWVLGVVILESLTRINLPASVLFFIIPSIVAFLFLKKQKTISIGIFSAEIGILIFVVFIGYILSGMN